MNEQPKNKLTDSPQFKSFMKKLAVIATILIVAGALMKVLAVHAGDTTLITGMGMLAFVAVFLGKIFPCPYQCGSMMLWNFAMTLSGYALATAIMGILFLVMHWPAGDRLLLLGIVVLAICGIVWLLYWLHYRKHSNDKIFEE